MGKIANIKRLYGRDNGDKFIAEFVTARGAKHGHIRISCEDGTETSVVTETWRVLLVYYITRALFLFLLFSKPISSLILKKNM